MGTDRKTWRLPVYLPIFWWVAVGYQAISFSYELASDHNYFASVMSAAIWLGLGWFYMTRPSVSLDGDGVTIVNPIRRYRIPLSSIAGFDDGWLGPRLNQTGGRNITLVALPKSNWAYGFGKTTRADRAIAEILRRRDPTDSSKS